MPCIGEGERFFSPHLLLLAGAFLHRLLYRTSSPRQSRQQRWFSDIDSMLRRICAFETLCMVQIYLLVVLYFQHSTSRPHSTQFTCVCCVVTYASSIMHAQSCGAIIPLELTFSTHEILFAGLCWLSFKQANTQCRG